jgi:hypothetical protein
MLSLGSARGWIVVSITSHPATHPAGKSIISPFWEKKSFSEIWVRGWIVISTLIHPSSAGYGLGSGRRAVGGEDLGCPAEYPGPGKSAEMGGFVIKAAFLAKFHEVHRKITHRAWTR